MTSKFQSWVFFDEIHRSKSRLRKNSRSQVVLTLCFSKTKNSGAIGVRRLRFWLPPHFLNSFYKNFYHKRIWKESLPLKIGSRSDQYHWTRYAPKYNILIIVISGYSKIIFISSRISDTFDVWRQQLWLHPHFLKGSTSPFINCYPKEIWKGSPLPFVGLPSVWFYWNRYAPSYNI